MTVQEESQSSENQVRAVPSRKKELGASLVEYGLLVALIAVIGIPAVSLMSTNMNISFREAKENLVASGDLLCANPLGCP